MDRFPTTPALHPTKKRVYYWLLAAGVILLVAVISTGYYQDVALAALVPGLITTCFAVSLPDLLPESDRLRKIGKLRANWQRWFGAAALRQPVEIVLSWRRLGGNVHDDPFVYPNAAGTKPMSAPNDIQSWEAIEDVQAAMSISDAIFKHSDKPCRLVLDDGNPNYPACCRVSIGLQVNGLTMNLGKLSGELFSVTTDPEGHPPRHRVKLPGPGGVHGVPAAGNADWGRAIIARVVGAGSDPDVVQFVCAGESAESTRAAGEYFAAHWDRLLELYKQHHKQPAKHSMAVLLEFKPATRAGLLLAHTACHHQIVFSE